jgi:hypothetical protein
MKKIIVPALTVFTLFAVACGEDPDASGPPILRITGGVSSDRNSADQTAGAPESSSSDKMMWMGQQHFTAVSDLPSLDSDAPSYVISASDIAKRDLNSLREVFAIKDEFVAQDANMGGGYLAGEYNTGDLPTMYVSADAMHYWSYQAPWSRLMTDVGCAIPPVAEGDTPSVEPPVAEGDSVTSVEPCSVPTPPENVPSAAQAEDLFEQMLKDLGLKPKDFITESYADEWNANVTGYLTIDGVRTSLSWSASYGADAELVWASGVLAEVTQAADYPRIGTAQGIERLNNDQQYGWGGPMARGGIAYDDMAGTSVDKAVASPGAPRALAQGIEPVSEELIGITVDTAPETLAGTVDTQPETLEGTVDTQPETLEGTVDSPIEDQEMPVIEIEIVAVEEELLSLYGADGSIYLVPGYAFLAAEESGWTPRYLVSALPDEFIEEANTDSVDLPTPDVTGAPTPETIVPETIDPSDPVVDEPNITQEAADTLLAMTEGDATKMALNNGWEVRVGQRDDEMFALTADWRAIRVTLTIMADEVTKVDVG